LFSMLLLYALFVMATISFRLLYRFYTFH
jgi:hypothetical protein